MKNQNKPHFVIMATIVAVFAALTWSCNKDDDPSLSDLREDKLQYLEDSLRISDSLKRINAAGIVNYAINVVNGSTSSLYTNASGAGRSEATNSAVDGAIVTVSQYGKTLTDTTDASGMVVFNGFFRTSVNVTVRREGFTTASYIAITSISQPTSNNTISFVGSIIPIFETTGANTATLSGRATIETDLTNKVREVVADGTTITASINAKSTNFASRFMTSLIDNIHTLSSSCGCDLLTMAEILEASYSTGVVGAVAGGSYTITVPGAIDGLPISLEYSEIAADQTLFEDDGAEEQHTIVRRTIFNNNSSLSAPIALLPASSSVDIDFESYSVQAQANAVISDATGAIAQINVTDGGSGYVGTPLVEIIGDGTGAAATATVGANGKVTGITLTNAGTGYTFAPFVSIISGFGADFVTTLGGTGTVVALNLLSTGEGYTSAPTVTITGGGATTDATATATVANGRVTGLTLVTGGAGYDGSAITVTITGGGATVDATASAVFSGFSVNQIVRVSGGADYTYAPVVEFSAPERPTGVRATGTAVIDADTREVVAINVTNSGSGYTNPPLITLSAGGGAAAQAYLAGGSVISFEITNEGADYAYPPTVVIGANNSGNGTGATGTPIMSGGRVVGITLTSGGTGYTSTPDVQLVSGDGAVAYATVTNGVITGFTVTDGGHDFAGAPRVVLDGDGGGATATATVAGGQITGITVVNGGSGYLEGNTPGSEVRFSATKGTALDTKPGITYINDVYYGTGAHRE